LSAPVLRGIPYNPRLYSTTPKFLFTRGERYYPMMAQNGALDQGRPQYVWDCMFRRFQGKILVAIFVYRVTIPGGGNVLYSVAPNGSNPNVPPTAPPAVAPVAVPSGAFVFFSVASSLVVS
jgi:hypothetical protein